MKIIPTAIDGCFVIEPAVFKDGRGYFMETFNAAKFKELTGIDTPFVQDNESYSNYGVIRGLHLQQGKHAQAKLVRCIKGTILDVAVDLRKESKTYMQYVAVELSGENKKQLYVPRGFAHGYSVLSEEALFAYKCDNFYNKGSEGGLRYDDPRLNIDWQLDASKVLVSDKDIKL
ncbi:dTDP-4-dehydrorhamnose 3,5-epimerase [Nonlabens ponticola]|uniref:dTDP-4-dehydrorhamnose 3,5-epimerase n=1 Tax=Nonlabens ponticola TaxID=2496866 RepID=A0A3S9MZY3_9FLAO|nr:dTDP-4-dehydrorhamnose 3,5-epimerase [Nonlabens ponticola]AZQ44708.1 dTDP-4-dehydrorhamnose 3,5-epimerase [Nonlabens ponticola]